MSYVPMQSKLIGETLEMEFSFQNQMLFGETLDPPLIASVVVTLISGQDAAPSQILSGGVTVSGATVKTKVTAGMAGVIYNLTFHATGSSGAIYKGTRRLAVLSDDGSFVPSSIPTLTGTLPDGIVGAAYSAALQISGGYMPYTPVGIISGAPAWMGFTVVDDELICAGTPDEATGPTNYVFSPQILDAALTPASAPQDIDITRVSISGDAPNGTIGAAYSYTYTFGNGTPPYTFAITAGSVYSGTTLNAASSEISGTPTTEEVKTWTVQITDANGVTDTVDDGGEVTVADIFMAIDNQGVLRYSSDSGLTFPSTVATGVSASTETGTHSVGNLLYHLGNTGRVSTDGVNFVDMTGLGVTQVGSMNIIKTPTEWIMTGIGSSDIFVSNDGIAFTTRTPGVTIRKPVIGVDGTILAMGGGRNLSVSIDDGATFSTYSLGVGVNAFEGVQFVFWTDFEFLCFANDASQQLTIGHSDTGLSGSWSFVAGPETGALTSICHGVAMSPAGRIVIVLENGHTWYTDTDGFIWTQGDSITYGGSPVYPPAQMNNMIYAGGAWLFGAEQGGGTAQSIIFRSTNGINWTPVYTGPNSLAIHSMCEFP